MDVLEAEADLIIGAMDSDAYKAKIEREKAMYEVAGSYTQVVCKTIAQSGEAVSKTVANLGKALAR